MTLTYVKKADAWNYSIDDAKPPNDLVWHYSNEFGINETSYLTGKQVVTFTVCCLFVNLYCTGIVMIYQVFPQSCVYVIEQYNLVKYSQFTMLLYVYFV